MIAMNDRPFVTARAAAELLGVSEATVIEDIERGMSGALASLVGGYYGADVLVVHTYEIEGARLAMHRTRLAVRESEGHG